MFLPFLRSDPAHLTLGKKGEAIAARFLRKSGYRILASNVRMGREEIDLIARDVAEQMLVFVEVKTRSQPLPDGFHPSWKAGARKRRALRKAVHRWIAQHEYDGGYRADLLCVDEGRVTQHFKGITLQT